MRQIQGRLYTRNLSAPLDAIVRRNVWEIAAGYFPGAVIVDRTAFDLRPSGPEGSVFLSSTTQRVVRLPGAVLNCRRGPGPIDGDLPFMDRGLALSSWPRRFLDNMRPSRSRSGIGRTLANAEIEDHLQTILANQGERELGRLRDQTRDIASALGAEREHEQLSSLIGTLLGTRDGQVTTERARATRRGLGWDERRLPLFDELLAALNAHVPVDRPARPTHMGPPFAFFEAYFSNFIEGTEFLVSEAEEIVFHGAIPSERPGDAHDILGTYDLVADERARGQAPADADSLEQLLRSAHARMLSGRPEISPGGYKQRANRAGQTVFVAPALIRGTLHQGMSRYLSLPPGFARAVFAMFLVAEVHPFIDGNGRVARVLANAELTAAGQQRMIIPTVLRDDYLSALRALSRQTNARPLVRVLDRAQELCALIDWTDLRHAEDQLQTAHAFLSPAEAEEAGVVLRLPA